MRRTLLCMPDAGSLYTSSSALRWKSCFQIKLPFSGAAALFSLIIPSRGNEFDGLFFDQTEPRTCIPPTRYYFKCSFVCEEVVFLFLIDWFFEFFLNDCSQNLVWREIYKFMICFLHKFWNILYFKQGNSKECQYLIWGVIVLYLAC